MDSTRQEKWPRQTTANPPNHHDQEQGQDHTTPVAAPGEPATAEQDNGRDLRDWCPARGFIPANPAPRPRAFSGRCDAPF